MDKFLSLSYYFGIRPETNFQFTKLTLLAVALLLLLGIGIRFYRKKYVKDEVAKKLLKRCPGALSAFAFLLLCLLLFREAGIPFLSMRIWGVILFIAFLYWAVKSAIGFKKEYHHRLSQAKRMDSVSQYLPRKKR